MDPSKYLDQLDEAREKATPGEWAQHPADGEYVIADISDDGDSYFDVADTYGFRNERSAADAALIVAAVNALPKLTAALRAVLDRHHPVSQNVYAATPVKDPVDVCAIDTTTTWPCQTVRAITNALAVSA